MIEFRLHEEHARAEASSGALCGERRNGHCRGWHSTQMDTWVPCSCNPGGRTKPHPEDDED